MMSQAARAKSPRAARVESHGGVFPARTSHSKGTTGTAGPTNMEAGSMGVGEAAITPMDKEGTAGGRLVWRRARTMALAPKRSQTEDER